MEANNLLIDAFDRIKENVHRTVGSLSHDDLAYRPTASANSISWLIWHVARIQDDHVAQAAGQPQVWDRKWLDKFALRFDLSDTGYGHSPSQVAAVKADAKTLTEYYDEVHDKTIEFIKKLSKSDYVKVVDTRWDPPVTLGVRLVSIVSDNLEHVGQAAYVRGLLKEK